MESPSPDISARQLAITARDRTVLDFDAINQEELADVLGNLQKVITLRLAAVVTGVEIGLGARFDALALFQTASDIVVSSLQMARQRAVLESLTLLRVALECGATALHAVSDSDAYTRLLSGEYKSTKALGYAAKLVPQIGMIYGALSEVAVHTTLESFGPVYRLDEGRSTKATETHFGVRPPRGKEQDARVLTLISLVTLVLIKVGEAILTEGTEKSPSWRRLVGTDKLYFHDTGGLIERYYAAVLSWSGHGTT